MRASIRSTPSSTSAIPGIRRAAFASRLLPAARLRAAAVSSVLVTLTAADIPAPLDATAVSQNAADLGIPPVSHQGGPMV